MKKYLILIAAFTTVLSCNKEQAIEEEAIRIETSLKITARLVEATPLSKTSYDEDETNPKFSWLSTDMIDVQLESVSVVGAHSHWTFDADGAGESTTFTKEDGEISGFQLGTFAFYPKHSTDAAGRDLVYNIEAGYEDVTIYEESTVPLAELRSLVPLIGIKNKDTNVSDTEGVTYDFKTATGILRVCMNNVPTTARAIRIVAATATDYLSGIVSLSDLADGEISMSDLKFEQANTRTFRFGFIPTEGQDIVAYIPIPTGTFTDGFTVELLGENDSQIISRTISEDVDIERNKVYFIPAITLDSDWKSIGTGWFGDNYLFFQIGKPGCMAPVDIQQNTSDSKIFRIRDPYGCATDYLGVELGGFHNSYFTFSVDGASISYEDHKTGIRYSGGSYANCNSLLHDNNSAKDIVTYQVDGKTPKLIKLSPKYYIEDTSGSKNYSVTLSDRSSIANVINIVFPGVAICEAWTGTYSFNEKKNSLTLAPESTESNYNIKITHYSNSSPCANFTSGGYDVSDVSGTCYGVYNPRTGRIVFPLLQGFADTGKTWTSGDHAGSKIYYSFRGSSGTYASNSQDLELKMEHQNCYWTINNNYFNFCRYVIGYNSVSGYCRDDEIAKGENTKMYLQ